MRGTISHALARAEAVSGKPALVICHTVKGKGIPYVENYPVKPNILLTEEKYQECLDHLAEVEKELVDG